MDTLFYLFELDWQYFFSNPTWIGLPILFVIIGLGVYFQIKNNNKEVNEENLRVKAGESVVKENADRQTKLFLLGLIIICIIVFLYYLIKWLLF